VSIASPNVPQTAERVAETTTRAPRENALQRWAAGLLGRRAFWAAFVLIAFSFPVSRVIRKSMPPKLPVLGTVGAFQLVNQKGTPFGTAELEGRVWVMSAIHTSSASAVDLAKELGKIQHRSRNLGQAFHLVTVGLDPVADAPDRLLEFSNHHRVSPRLWSFLSGDPAALRLAHAGLGLQLIAQESAATSKDAPVGPGPRDAPAPKFDSEKGPLSVAVVDGKMRVRGRYDLADPTAIDTLLYHVGLLVNRGD
jgi:cytochrome oxidase Cu insertion factor (SCO1/SenC/PrrC family)